MSRANLDLFEADLSASLSNLQRILNFYPLRNLASNELFFNSIKNIGKDMLCLKYDINHIMM